MSAMGRSVGRNNPRQDRFGRGGSHLADNSRARPFGRGRGSVPSHAGGGRTSRRQRFLGRKNVGDSHGAPPGKMLRLDDDSRKSGSPCTKEFETQFDQAGGQNRHKFLMYCALCNFNTMEAKEMDSHMECDEHKSSLLIVDKHFPKEKMFSRFLHERIRMLNKRIEISKRLWEKKHGISDMIKQPLKETDIPDCMQQMDVVHCPSCRTFIPALEWEVQAHLQSMRHASNFQDIQKKNFFKIRDIGINVLRKRRDNTQYEFFKKGEDPFAAEIQALENVEEQEEETMVKGEAKAKTFAEVKKILKKNVQNKGQEDEKEKVLEEDQTKDRQISEQAVKVESVKARDEEEGNLLNDRDVLEQDEFGYSGDSDIGEEEGTDEEERHLLEFGEEEEEYGDIV